MFTRVANEITQLLADDDDWRPSATQRLAKARLVASIAEGLGRAPVANRRAGLSDGWRAGYLDARLSPEERHLVVSALLCDPEDRAEMSSAAALLECIGAESSPLPAHLVARAATTFVQSAADQTAAIAGRRAWGWRAPLALVTSFAALILLMLVVPGLRSAGKEPHSPFAEPTGSAQSRAQSATAGSESVAGGLAIDRKVEATESARSTSASGVRTSISCEDGREVADHGASDVGSAKDGAARPPTAAGEASCGSQAPAADTHSTKPLPRFDGPSLRASRQSNDFRLAMAIDGLYAIPDGLFEIAGRAVSLVDQIGKKTLALVDPRCAVGRHQIAREKLSSVSRKNSTTSLWCRKHVSLTFPVAVSRDANKDRVQ